MWASSHSEADEEELPPLVVSPAKAKRQQRLKQLPEDDGEELADDDEQQEDEEDDLESAVAMCASKHNSSRTAHNSASQRGSSVHALGMADRNSDSSLPCLRHDSSRSSGGELLVELHAADAQHRPRLLDSPRGLGPGGPMTTRVADDDESEGEEGEKGEEGEGPKEAKRPSTSPQLVRVPPDEPRFRRELAGARGSAGGEVKEGMPEIVVQAEEQARAQQGPPVLVVVSPGHDKDQRGSLGAPHDPRAASLSPHSSLEDSPAQNAHASPHSPPSPGLSAPSSPVDRRSHSRLSPPPSRPGHRSGPATSLTLAPDKVDELLEQVVETPEQSRARQRREEMIKMERNSMRVAKPGDADSFRRPTTPNRRPLVGIVVVGTQEFAFGSAKGPHASGAKEDDKGGSGRDRKREGKPTVRLPLSGRSKLLSLLSSDSSKFEEMISSHYGNEYHCVATESLGDMRLMVLCVDSLRPHIKGIKKVHKATGIGGVIGNKGGLMVKLTVHKTDLCFLSCHLAAHESEEKVAKRNQDVHDILKAASNAGKQKLDVTQRYHHTFLFGDLNYRINLAIKDKRAYEEQEHRQEVMRLINAKEYAELYRADQLVREVKANNVLHGFHEAIPSFEPTFKVLRGESLEYNLHRVPSYCDRILWTSLPGLESKVTQQGYMSANEANSSDHKPVFSVFLVDVQDTQESSCSPRNASAQKRRGSLAMLARPRRSAWSLRIGRLKALNVNDEIFELGEDVVVKFTGPALVADKVIVHPKMPDDDEQNFLVDLVFDNVNLALKLEQEQLQGCHVIMSMWDRERGKKKKLLAQTAISLDPWACSRNDHAIAQKLVRYGMPCGEITAVVCIEPVA